MGINMGIDASILTSPWIWIGIGTFVPVTLAGLIALFFVHTRNLRARTIAHRTTFPTSIEAVIPESRFVDVNGARLHYVQAGKGPDVVLLHGIGASIFIWRFLFPLLQTRHRVTAIDLPGFGKSCKEPHRDYGLDSQTDLVQQATVALGLERPLLVGSSMGGAIALWLARRSPDLFPRVAVLSPATDPRRVPTLVRHFSLGAPYLRHALNRRSMKLILGYVLAKRELIDDKTIDAYLEPFRDTGEGVRAFWSATTLLSDRRLPAELKDVRSEVLVIYGEKDMMVLRRSINELMRILPNASLLTHPEAGHHIMEDEPVWLALELEKLLAKS